VFAVVSRLNSLCLHYKRSPFNLLPKSRYSLRFDSINCYLVEHLLRHLTSPHFTFTTRCCPSSTSPSQELSLLPFASSFNRIYRILFRRSFTAISSLASIKFHCKSSLLKLLYQLNTPFAFPHLQLSTNRARTGLPT